MLHEEELLACITTSCSDLDSILGGGINCKEVTEIGGVPGIGKTQLGIQLAVNVQIPVDYGGLGGKAIYIVLSLVKDAAARLPASIGTKADIYTLICKRARSTCSSCFLLVRISLACDPCIRHDRDLQLWVYLHGEREDDEFEDHGPCPSKNRQVQAMQREGEVHQGR